MSNLMKLLIAAFWCVFLSITPLCKAQTQQTQMQTQTQTAPQDEPPPDTDIYLLPWPPDAAHESTIQNMTHRKGYDNQPMFSPDGQRVFFTSIGPDEQADIYIYSIKDRVSKKFTNTPESEYSPTFMPDGENLSVVRVEKDQDKTQRLWKFPLTGGDPALVLTNVKPVGYHCWIDANRVALFILGEPNTLQIADTNTGKAEKIADNIGRSMHKIPSTENISFTVKEKEGWIIQELNPATKQIKTLVKGLDTSEDYIWISGGKILMANGTKLYEWDSSQPQNDWTQVADLSKSGIGKITRLALHPKGTLLAFVAEEKP